MTGVAACGSTGGSTKPDPTTVSARTVALSTATAHPPRRRDRVVEAVTVARTRYGRALVDRRGFALYLFTRDRSADSTCYGACAAAWPPYVVAKRPPPVEDTPDWWAASGGGTDVFRSPTPVIRSTTTSAIGVLARSCARRWRNTEGRGTSSLLTAARSIEPDGHTGCAGPSRGLGRAGGRRDRDGRLMPPPEPPGARRRLVEALPARLAAAGCLRWGAGPAPAHSGGLPRSADGGHRGPNEARPAMVCDLTRLPTHREIVLSLLPRPHVPPKDPLSPSCLSAPSRRSCGRARSG